MIPSWYIFILYVILPFNGNCKIVKEKDYACCNFCCLQFDFQVSTPLLPSSPYSLVLWRGEWGPNISPHSVWRLKAKLSPRIQYKMYKSCTCRINKLVNTIQPIHQYSICSFSFLSLFGKGWNNTIVIPAIRRSNLIPPPVKGYNAHYYKPFKS